MVNSLLDPLLGRSERLVSSAETLRATIVKLRSVSTRLQGRGRLQAVEIRDLLSDFSAQLSTHLDTEEHAIGSGGSIAPEGSLDEDEATALLHVHDALRDLAASVRRFARDGGEAGELGLRIDRLINDFEQSERKENAALQESFLRDEGSSE